MRGNTTAAPAVIDAPPAPVKRTEAQAELARLLVRQSEIADMPEPSEADGLEYASNGERIKELGAAA
jgi:hypothetical protein